MKRILPVLGFVLAMACTVLLAKVTADSAAKLLLDQPQAETSAAQTLPTVPPAEVPAETTPQTQPPVETVAETTMETLPPEVYTFTPEEEELLLKLGMAERGDTGCVECIALVMRTALNRMESGRFSSTLRGVIYAEDQFTPVAEGTFEKAKPNDDCTAALELVRRGWDESQGALYYEWCEGESWHSRNLQLLTQHCDTRFYR